MSNRINLTQFERHTPGPWTIVCSIFAGRYYLKQAEERDASDDEDCANADLMEAGPDLLAELKKCYEEIDVLRGGLDMAHRCLSAHNFRQCDTCGDHYHDDYGPLCGHDTSE